MTTPEKPKINEALQDFIRFLNIFPMVQGLREGLEVALNIEGETARLNKEKKEAQDEKGYILQEIGELEKKREQLEAQVSHAKEAAPAQVEAESKRIKENLQRAKDELKNFRTSYQQEKESLTREIGDLRANKAQLTGQIETLQANVKDKTAGSEREIRAVEEEKTTVTAELAKLRELVEEKRIEAREVGTKEARAAMAGEKERLNRQIADLNAQKLSLNAHIDTLNRNVKDLTARQQRETEHAEEERTKAADELAKLRAEINEAQLVLHEMKGQKAKAARASQIL